MVAVHLLGAKRREDHQLRAAQSAAHEAQDLQRRLVGPVDVLEQEQHRPLRQHVAHLLEPPEPARARLVVQQPGQFGQGVRERAQRFRRRDVVAATAPDVQPGGLVGQGARVGQGASVGQGACVG